MKHLIINLFIVIIITCIMLPADFVLYIGFNENLMQGYAFSVYGGWFDWMTVLGWIPRIITGFLAGVCVVLLAFGENSKKWAQFTGVVMTVTAYVGTKSIWLIEPTLVERVFYKVWPLMYVVGTYLGYVSVVKFKYLLAKHQS